MKNQITRNYTVDQKTMLMKRKFGKENISRSTVYKIQK